MPADAIAIIDGKITAIEVKTMTLHGGTWRRTRSYDTDSDIGIRTKYADFDDVMVIEVRGIDDLLNKTFTFDAKVLH